MANDAADENANPVSPDAAATPCVAPVSLGESPVPAEARIAKLGSLRSRLPTRRAVALCFAFLVPSAVIAISGVFIVRDIADHPKIEAHPEGGAPSIAASGVTAATSNVTAPQPAASQIAAQQLASQIDASPLAASAPVAASASAVSESPAVPAPVFYDETDDGEPSPAKRVSPKHFGTVQQAVAGSCSTASVEGLSRQIIEQARCIRQKAFVPLPTRPNLVLAAHVFPYLELGARNHLLRVLDAHPNGKMTINSALRTVAQQYLVWRWSAGKQCGVQLATPPGESNHEIGMALDIAEAAQWRSALESQEFHWLGTSDRVHFDYKGGDPSPHSAADVLAFQILWNRNHPHDSITADGHYNPATEQRLKKSPADGFPVGPSCSKAGASGR